MVVYKASFIHPYTHIPFNIYYNKSEGYVTLEKDMETLELVLNMQTDDGMNEAFLEQVDQASSVCENVYPCDSFNELYEFLERIGVELEDISFQSMYLH
ncbi:hypothetical protein [Bacillus sp. JCM 19034]|uniref:hypothetical protein n=1 Tax=Bacillus sp. JCM 19034 TaxID=1481928 RepID=UPI00078573B4|nr:hypothetical protein [Bacillus sp. JCM 19034]